MTVPMVPTLPLEFASGEPRAAAALVRLHAAGILRLPGEKLSVIRCADVLGRAERAAGATATAHADAEASRARQRAVAELARQATAGQVTDAATDPYVAHLAAVPALKVRHEVILEAARAASRSAVESVKAWLRSPTFAGHIVEALDRILDEADAAAGIMAAAPFAYTDPSALHRADRPVQTAFASLLPVATRHDLLRAAVVDLWDQRDAGDPPEALHGAGVVRIVRPSDGALVWRYQPEGHPVQRLVAAVSARNGDPVEA